MMKAKFIRDDLECTARQPDESQTVIKEITRSGKVVKRRFWKQGATVEDPRAYRLVQMGVAVPADEECQKAAGMTPEQMQAAAKAQERLLAGILPEDFRLFDRGVITGYHPDGSYELGPNGHELEELEDDDDDIICTD